MHRSIETLPWIEKEYVDSGKVQMIFLDLPLWMHPDALQAAEAAQCAGDQGRFWEFHDELFANYSTFSPDDFGGYATDLELDVTAFAACLERGKLAGIREDLRVANLLGITGTPAFVLGRRTKKGDKVEVLEVLKGAVPFEMLRAKIDAHLGQD